MPTILWPGREPFESDGLAVAPGLVGWEAESEGLCRGESCVPFPVVEGRIDLVSFAERLGAPFVRDGDVWSFGEAVARAPLAIAPDFTLPDLGGRAHSLSDHRGRKVLLVAWASW